MKIGLFVALVVLLAATHVFGGPRDKHPTKEPGEPNREPTDPEGGDNNGGKDRPGTQDETEPTHRPDVRTTPRPDDETEVSTRPPKHTPADAPTSEANPDAQPPTHDRPPHDGGERLPNQADLLDGKDKDHVVLKETTPRPMESDHIIRRIHVKGRLHLRKHDSRSLISVEYGVAGTDTPTDTSPKVDMGSLWSNEYIARGSRVTLYAATTKTTDRKLAFAEFEIKFIENHFPLRFEIDVELPSRYLGLVERSDITLYFFAYITNPELRIDTFVPSGVSQIFLQGTGELTQPLIVNVRANGILIDGLFRGRFGSLYIPSGTTFEVQIVSEDTLLRIQSGKYDAVSQITITNVPAMFPVACSLLVPYQLLQSNTKYFAIAFSIRNGYRTLLPQRPVLVINEQKLVVTSQVHFIVMPVPFMLKGLVVRASPGPYVIQPDSSLYIRLREDGTKGRDIIFKLSNLVTLPQFFQLNMTEATRFDPSKRYHVRAFVADHTNVYMITSGSITLNEDGSKLIVPVEDYFHYVRVRITSSLGGRLQYFKGSNVRCFITHTPEVPSTPIASVNLHSIEDSFQELIISVPVTAIERNHNYYIVVLIESEGVLSHVGKLLLISNNQPPPLIITLPVLSLNLITGTIYDIDSLPAQWSSSSYATIYLVTGDREIVQTWKVHVENEFPVRFELRVDFSLIRPDRIYRLQAAIMDGRTRIEYQPYAGRLLYQPGQGFHTEIRVPVRLVKVSQLIQGTIQISGIEGPLPTDAIVDITLSATSSLTNPTIIEEISIDVAGLTLPIHFAMNVSLSKIDITSVYYILVRYRIGSRIIISRNQAFAMVPRNEADIIIKITNEQQVVVRGQIASTGSFLRLPSGARIHVFITDNLRGAKPTIYGETTMIATLNSIYEFNIYIDAFVVEKRIPLYLVVEILFEGKVILTIPKPALLQLIPGGDWNVNIYLDLPTLIVGKIVTLGSREDLKGDFDLIIEVIKAGTSTVIHTIRLRINSNLSHEIRFKVPFELFIQYQKLEVRALIKNCREQILFKSGDAVAIIPGLNLGLVLNVVLVDSSKLDEIPSIIDETALLNLGNWVVSIAATDNNPTYITDTNIDNIIIKHPAGKPPVLKPVISVNTVDHTAVETRPVVQPGISVSVKPGVEVDTGDHTVVATQTVVKPTVSVSVKPDVEVKTGDHTVVETISPVKPGVKITTEVKPDSGRRIIRQ